MHRQESDGEFEVNPEYPQYTGGVEGQGIEEYRRYRYVKGGLLVYDAKARYSDANPGVHMKLLPRISLSEDVTKDLDHCDDYGTLHPDRSKYLTSPLYPCSKYINEEYTLSVPANSLRFDSKFEGGNLSTAVMVTDTEYELSLDYDTNTKGFTQWFYFSVTSSRADFRVRFSIVNLMKYESLYNSGLKPVVKVGNGQWQRAGSNVAYYQNNIPRVNPNNDPKIPTHFYSLTFSYVFTQAEERVYFAHCYPYTYTDLTRYLDTLQREERYKDRLRVDVMCKTLAGNDCFLVTVTEEIASFPQWKEEESVMMKSAAGRRLLRQRMSRLETVHSNKKGVVLTARVHPGESNSSYMLQGALNFLLSDTREAALLRHHFIFRLVPMLNPDGVIYGNYRCSLLGVDLNRRWKAPSRFLHPTVFYTKKMMQSFGEMNELLLYCDMHGHSMKKNVFMYACRVEPPSHTSNSLIHLFPRLFSKTNPIFVYSDCHFRLEPSKQSTGRMVVFQEFGVLNSYTLEASFYGPKTKAQLAGSLPAETEDFDAHMNTSHMESIGRDLCKVMVVFTSNKMLRFQINGIQSPKQVGMMEEKQGEEQVLNVQSAMEVIAETGTQLNIGGNRLDTESDGGSDSLGSDNDDQKQAFLYQQKQGKKTQKVTKRRSLSHIRRSGVRPKSSYKRLTTEASPAPVRVKTPVTTSVKNSRELPRPGSQRQINRIYKMCR